MAKIATRGLFRAMRTQRAPEMELGRRKEDFYPTPPEPTRALLAAEEVRLRDFVTIWEPSAGDGAMASEIEAVGWDVFQSDLVDRGCGAVIQSFYDFNEMSRPSRAIIGNPPYNEINARDGHGRWLKHTFDLNPDYVAYLLNWDWPAARANGLDRLLTEHPISRVYLCRWKIDFTGGGYPPQRNGWFVWDKKHEGETVLRFLDREMSLSQKSLFEVAS